MSTSNLILEDVREYARRKAENAIDNKAGGREKHLFQGSDSTCLDQVGRVLVACLIFGLAHYLI